VINAVSETELERVLSEQAEQGYELQSLCVGPTTAFVAVVRKAVPISITETPEPRPAQRSDRFKK
jgi:hypothetical protein